MWSTSKLPSPRLENASRRFAPWTFLVPALGHLIEMGDRHNEKVANDALGFDRIGKRTVVVDAVVVPPTFPDTGKGVYLFKVGNNSLHSSFRNPDMDGTLAQSHVRVFMKKHQHMRVMGKKGPCRRMAYGRFFRFHKKN